MTAEMDTGTVTVEHSSGDGTVKSESVKTSELQDSSLDVTSDEPEKPDISKAASELGKKGGEAAAKARAKAAREERKAEKEKAEEEPDAQQAALKYEGEGEGEEEVGDDGRPLGKPRHDPRARVAQVTREHAETKRKLREVEQELDRHRTERRLQEVEARTRTPEERQTQERPQIEEPPEYPGEPSIEDFDDFGKYLKAFGRWNREAAMAEMVARVEYANDIHTKWQANHNAKLNFAKEFNEQTKDDPDFRSRIAEEVLDLRPTSELGHDERPDALNDVAEQIKRRPKVAPAILLHLSENPDELQRLATLRTPQEVIWEMASLAASLTAATTATSGKAPFISKAKPPIRPVSGEPHAAIPGESPDEEDFDSFMRREDTRETARGRRSTRRR